MSNFEITGGAFTGAHLGDNIYHLYAAGQTFDDDFQFDTYAEAVRAKLQAVARTHVPLTIEPLASRLGEDLKVVPNAETTLARAVGGHRLVVVLGSAGAGKSESMRHLTVSGWDDDEVRIYVELARYRKPPNLSDLDALLIIVGEAVRDLSGSDRPPSIALLRRLLRERRVSLLLDGLNEVEASVRVSCLRSIQDTASTFEACRVVFSTRPNVFEPIKGWTIFRLRELDDEQVAQFLCSHADASTRTAILEHLKISENPLLHLPLFLKYVIELLREAPADPSSVLGSRTRIVSSYVRYLFQREMEKGQALDEPQLRAILGALGRRAQELGQSLAAKETIDFLVARFGHDAAWFDALIVSLTARGFLAREGGYIRFWHHTLQEYFFAAEQLPILTNMRSFRRFRNGRLLGRRTDEDALTFLAAIADEAQLGPLVPLAVRKNVSLAARWANDLSVDGRAEGVVTRFVNHVRRDLDRVATWSRLSTERLILFKTFLVVVGAWIVYVLFDSLRTPPLFIPMEDLAHSRLYENAFYVGIAVLLSLGTLFILYSMIRYPGCNRAAEIAGAARNVRSAELRKRLAAVVERVIRRPLASIELRELLGRAVEREDARGLIESLATSQTPYLAIQLLAFADDDRASSVLQTIVEAGGGNVYSRVALHAMLRRALREEEEVQRLKTLAAEIWKNRRYAWRYHHMAGKCLAAFDSRFRYRYVAILAFHLTLTVVAYLGIVVPLQLLLLFAATRSDGLSIIVLPPLFGAAFWYWSRRLGARRIRGYYGLDGFSPRGYALGTCLLGLLSLTAIPIALFLLNVRAIRRNARGLDLDMVRHLIATTYDDSVH